MTYILLHSTLRILHSPLCPLCPLWLSSFAFCVLRVLCGEVVLLGGRLVSGQITEDSPTSTDEPLSWRIIFQGGVDLAKIKTLLLTGGEIHDWKGVGDEVEPILRDAGSFDVTRVNNDLSVLEAPNLEPYDLIVFYYTVGSITDAQKNGLLNWVASGKGYVGIHSAADSFRDCPEYRAMVGGWFVTHPAYRQYQVSVVDPEHPITKDLVEFLVTDEMYVTDYDPRVNVLATSLWKGGTVPVAWTKPWGKGRVYWLALGHDGPACKQDVFKTLLIRGAEWAANPESK